VAAENDGLRIAEPSCIPSAIISSLWPETSCCLFSVSGVKPFGGGGSTFDPSEAETRPDSACELVACPTLDVGTTGAFLRDLKENFLGGLKVLRVA
jgi:hypothetical protein